MHKQTTGTINKHLLQGAFVLALLALVIHVIPRALGQRDIRKKRLVDAEAPWVWQNPLPQGNDLRGASFVDAKTGTVVGYYGTIVRTTDGGNSWTIQTSGTTQNLWAVSFADVNNGTAVGEGGTILRTTDGGGFWASQASGTTVQFRGVSFTDENNGTAVGEGGMLAIRAPSSERRMAGTPGHLKSAERRKRSTGFRSPTPTMERSAASN